MSKPSQNSRYGMHAEDAAGVMTLKSKQHVILNEGGGGAEIHSWQFM